jgi:hypothetical protein
MAIIPNLDALIPREDFDILSEDKQELTNRDTIDISALVRGHFFYQALRKPDFQRETSHWSADKVAELIRTFLDGELVPAIILWSTGANTFVIDGAHRLSALIAWVNEDYGDGVLSLPFFGKALADDQIKASESTKKLIAKEVGTYEQYKRLAEVQDPNKPEMSARAKRLGSVSLRVQWVAGNSKNAEDAFYRINLNATTIDDTELSMIRARRKPNALATRAIVRAGSGHKYWSGFNPEVQREIEERSAEIYNLLCEPPLVTPIRSLDLPAVGSGYSIETTKLIYDFVNFTHDLRSEMWLDKSKKVRGIPRMHDNALADDADGTETIKYLRRIRNISDRITGSHPGSLGLHPAVYFYGATGNIQPTAFLAVVKLIEYLEKENALDKFTAVRSRFEEFLVNYRHFINQIGRTYGSGTKGLEPLFTMYKIIFKLLHEGREDAQIVEAIQRSDGLQFITVISEEDKLHGRNFSKETKSGAMLKASLVGAARCSICRARLHVKSISFDHVKRLADGGTGHPSNCAPSHFYCNTTFKN